MMSSSLTRMAVTAFALIAIAAGSNAHAQATIDQGKAQAGNVTPGDAPAFPVTLSVPGSYKLTGNLVVPSGVSGIEISADGVTLDLNGFTISSSGFCTRDISTYGVSCSAEHGLYGILVTRSLVTTVIRNGTVQGFAAGVLVDRGIVESLVVKHNAEGLLFGGLYAASRATGIVAELNGTGVYMSSGMIERSVATANTTGFFGSSVNNVAVVESQAAFNADGIRSAAVRGNRANNNKIDLNGTVAF